MANVESERPPAFPWHTSTIEECLEELECDKNILKVGLTTEQAKLRLSKFGPNKLSEKAKVTLFQRIWRQVANVLVGILVFVAIVSAVRAATAKETNTIITNWIEVGLIAFVIT